MDCSRNLSIEAEQNSRGDQTGDSEESDNVDDCTAEDLDKDINPTAAARWSYQNKAYMPMEGSPLKKAMDAF